MHPARRRLDTDSRPGNDDAFDTILDPVRKSTPDAAVDSFLERRLEEREQQLVRDALDGTRP
jgi:hypothetical protein